MRADDRDRRGGACWGVGGVSARAGGSPGHDHRRQPSAREAVRRRADGARARFDRWSGRFACDSERHDLRRGLRAWRPSRVRASAQPPGDPSARGRFTARPRRRTAARSGWCRGDSMSRHVRETSGATATGGGSSRATDDVDCRWLHRRRRSSQSRSASCLQVRSNAPTCRLPRASSSAASTAHDVVIAFEDAPAGYLWSFPRPDHLAVGICAQADESTTPQLQLRARGWIDALDFGRRSARSLCLADPVADRSGAGTRAALR